MSVLKFDLSVGDKWNSVCYHGYTDVITTNNFLIVWHKGESSPIFLNWRTKSLVTHIRYKNVIFIQSTCVIWNLNMNFSLRGHNTAMSCSTWHRDYDLWPFFEEGNNLSHCQAQRCFPGGSNILCVISRMSNRFTTLRCRKGNSVDKQHLVSHHLDGSYRLN